MINGSTDKNLTALEDLLSGQHERAKKGEPAVAEEMHEALMLCRTSHTVHRGIHMHLRFALESIRVGRPEEATRYIEIALGIQAEWIGDVQ